MAALVLALLATVVVQACGDSGNLTIGVAPSDERAGGTPAHVCAFELASGDASCQLTDGGFPAEGNSVQDGLRQKPTSCTGIKLCIIIILLGAWAKSQFQPPPVATVAATVCETKDSTDCSLACGLSEYDSESLAVARSSNQSLGTLGNSPTLAVVRGNSQQMQRAPQQGQGQTQQEQEQIHSLHSQRQSKEREERWQWQQQQQQKQQQGNQQWRQQQQQQQPHQQPQMRQQQRLWGQAQQWHLPQRQQMWQRERQHRLQQVQQQQQQPELENVGWESSGAEDDQDDRHCLGLHQTATERRYRQQQRRQQQQQHDGQDVQDQQEGLLVQQQRQQQQQQQQEQQQTPRCAGQVHLRLQSLYCSGEERREDVYVGAHSTVASLKARHFAVETAEGCRIRCIMSGIPMDDADVFADARDGTVVQFFVTHALADPVDAHVVEQAPLPEFSFDCVLQEAIELMKESRKNVTVKVVFFGVVGGYLVYIARAASTTLGLV